MSDISDQNIVYPLEVVIEGTPISLQGSVDARSRWKEVVRRAGQDRARETDDLGLLYPCPVALTIYYFPSAPMIGDIDNIVKPISDALIGVAYQDDRLIERVTVQKFEPQMSFGFESLTEQLSKALDLPPPVVYVRVDNDLRWRRARA